MAKILFKLSYSYIGFMGKIACEKNVIFTQKKILKIDLFI